MSAKKQLQRELAALQHELRRINDGLERNPTRALQQRARQLHENIALCQHPEQVLCSRAIMSMALGKYEPDRSPFGIDQGMDFGRQSAS